MRACTKLSLVLGFGTFAALLHCRVRRNLLVIDQLRCPTDEEEIETEGGDIARPEPRAL